MSARVLVLAVAAVAVVLVSLATHSGFGAFFFAQGSDVLVTALRPSLPVTIVVGLLLVVGAALLLRRESVTAFAAALLVCLSLWTLFCRTVGFHAYGSVYAGWFFVRTTTIPLRTKHEDVDNYVHRWEVRELPGWRLELRSGSRAERIFVGPLLMRGVLSLFRDRGFEVHPVDEVSVPSSHAVAAHLVEESALYSFALAPRLEAPERPRLPRTPLPRRAG